MSLGQHLEAQRAGPAFVDSRLHRQHVGAGLAQRQDTAVADEIAVVDLVRRRVEQAPDRVDVVRFGQKIEQHLVPRRGAEAEQLRTFVDRRLVDLGVKRDRLRRRRREQPEGIVADGRAAAVHVQPVIARAQPDERIGAAKRVGVGTVEVARHDVAARAAQRPGQAAVGRERIEVDLRIGHQAEGVAVDLAGNGQRAAGRRVQAERSAGFNHAVQGETVADCRVLIRGALDQQRVVAAETEREHVLIGEIAAHHLAPVRIEDPHVRGVAHASEHSLVEEQAITGAADKVVHDVRAARVERSAHRRVVADAAAAREVEQTERKATGLVAARVHRQQVISGHQIEHRRGAAEVGRIRTRQCATGDDDAARPGQAPVEVAVGGEAVERQPLCRVEREAEARLLAGSGDRARHATWQCAQNIAHQTRGGARGRVGDHAASRLVEPVVTHQAALAASQRRVLGGRNIRRRAHQVPDPKLVECAVEARIALDAGAEQHRVAVGERRTRRESAVGGLDAVDVDPQAVAGAVDHRRHMLPLAELHTSGRSGDTLRRAVGVGGQGQVACAVKPDGDLALIRVGVALEHQRRPGAGVALGLEPELGRR